MTLYDIEQNIYHAHTLGMNQNNNKPPLGVGNFQQTFSVTTVSVHKSIVIMQTDTIDFTEIR